MKNIRTLAILLLDDEHGINEQAFNALVPALVAAGHQDILDAVEVSESRYFLNEGDADRLLTIPDNDFSTTEASAGTCACGEAH